ncbi:uncharacterized protein LOC125813754 [Solanum verrucosum]|uniref:uncharacterized protein LOC125813754 n=1 Tax=Solanum verrucosum TaxID=315347 RepID=UPI0020D01272|nr:uncharacterized protein LOC125813754 [Solanum verrucosum]
MGHLAHSADVRDTKIERDVPFMIEAAILAALIPLQRSVDTLTMRVGAFERRLGETFEDTTLKAEVADIRKDVHYLKSTDFTSLLKATNDLDIPDTSEIPPATTRDVNMDEAAFDESDAETDEEQIEIRKGSIYGDLTDLE